MCIIFLLLYLHCHCHRCLQQSHEKKGTSLKSHVDCLVIITILIVVVIIILLALAGCAPLTHLCLHTRHFVFLLPRLHIHLHHHLNSCLYYLHRRHHHHHLQVATPSLTSAFIPVILLL